VKTLAFIVRRAGTTPDAFRNHYESVHAPLALPLLDGLRRYVRHHVRNQIVGGAPFDCMTSFWWRPSTAFDALMARLDSEAGAALRRDEESFMNRPEQESFPVAEGAADEPEHRLAANLLILVKRPPEAHLEEFTKGYEKQSLPELISSALSPRVCARDRALIADYQEPCFDYVTALQCESNPAEHGILRAWAQPLAASGARVVVVGVTEHESEIPKRGD
jgi:uncharacterized protein (TIGR02118 family)